MSNTRTTVLAARARKQLVTAEVLKLDAFIASLTAAQEKVEGEGDWVVYTGGTDCPVFVAFNENLTGVLFNINLARATRFKVRATALRMARNVYNGNNERGNILREREAYELMIANMMRAREMMNDLIPA